MEYKVVELEISDQIATIMLNRPDRLNAWTMKMHAEYRSALKAADEDANVRAIIVTGKGMAPLRRKNWSGLVRELVKTFERLLLITMV